MSDRELLELAAKANGWNSFEGQANQMIESGWNPLSDDGDAFRLAVHLKMDLLQYEGYACADYSSDEPHGLNGVDAYSATRRAIVTAAAKIGQKMT